jgi:hypothetical protein
MAAGAKVIRDGAEWAEELLGVRRGLEALEGSFSSPSRPMRVLRAIIQALVPAVVGRQNHGGLCGAFVHVVQAAKYGSCTD